MKKFFAAAMVVASVMASCSNGSNDMVNELDPANKPSSSENSSSSSTVNTTFDGTLYFAATDAQMEVMNVNYAVTVGSETLTVNVADLQKTYVVPMILHAEGFEKYRAAYDGLYLYVYHVPAGKVGKVTVTPTFSLKEGVTVPAELNTVLCSAYSGKARFTFSKGLSGLKVKDYISTVNSHTLLTTELK